jgi:hypothetical protein
VLQPVRTVLGPGIAALAVEDDRAGQVALLVSGQRRIVAWRMALTYFSRASPSGQRSAPDRRLVAVAWFSYCPFGRSSCAWKGFLPPRLRAFPWKRSQAPGEKRAEKRVGECRTALPLKVSSVRPSSHLGEAGCGCALAAAR